jgi:cytochrome c biogenesis protein
MIIMLISLPDQQGRPSFLKGALCMRGRDRDKKQGLMSLLLLKAAGSMSSPRLTAAVLLWIAAMCIVGTIVPQHQTFPFSRNIPLAARIHLLAGFSDVFHSIWLILPAIVLVMNSLACMAFWIRGRVRQDSIPPLPQGHGHELILPPDTESRQIRQDLVAGLARGYRIRQAERGLSWRAFGEKSRMRALAPALVHAGVIVILSGVALGTLGYEGSIRIAEGSATDEARLDDGSSMRLPFTVRCSGFKIDYYKNGMPREYRSELSFIKDGRVMIDGSLTVNHPMSFGGILFAQSGYDQSWTATIGVKAGSAAYHAVTGEETFFDLPDKGYRVHVMQIVENVMNMGPAAELAVDTPGGQRHLWIFRDFGRIQARFPNITERVPEFDPSSIKPYTFTFEKESSRYMTILKLNRDPGVIPVAIGALLFLIGILTVFLVPKNCIWIALDQSEQFLKVKVVRSQGGRVRDVDDGVMEALEALRGGRS